MLYQRSRPDLWPFKYVLAVLFKNMEIPLQNSVMGSDHNGLEVYKLFTACGVFPWEWGRHFAE